MGNDEIVGLPDYRITGLPDYRITGLPDYRITRLLTMSVGDPLPVTGYRF